jgi:DNA-binding NtrC family response regulator
VTGARRFPHLSTFFLREACERLAKPGVRLTAETLDIFDTFPWPGNVRQLRNEVQRAVAMATPGGAITPDLLSPVFGVQTAVCRRRRPIAPPDELWPPAVEKIEREMIQTALERSSGNNLGNTHDRSASPVAGFISRWIRLGVS